MSEHIVHTGILEDSAALLPYLKQIPDSFVKALEKHLEFARLGCITVAGDTFSFRLLEEFKPRWKNRDDLLEAKLAFVLGWVSHRACDRTMKPIWHTVEITGRGSDANPAVSPTECSVYHEGTLYNLYYADDAVFRLAVFPEELARWAGAELFDLPLAAEFVESAYGMNMMDNQTFPLPTGGRDQQFMESMCIRAQKFYVDMSRYARAARSPRLEHKQEYVKAINWYDAQDDVLKTVRLLRRGGCPDAETVEKAVNTPGKSYYAQALQLSIKYISAAADYFNDDRMGMEVLKERLDIGKKGPGGLGV
jgi:hypothetical protein